MRLSHSQVFDIVLHMAIDAHIFEVVELIRNGAIISGDNMQSNLFRQRCLEFAYHKLSTNVIPRMIEDGTLSNNDKLENLTDVNVLLQKNVIRPELAQITQAFV
jgi:hypothetical protein